MKSRGKVIGEIVLYWIMIIMSCMLVYGILKDSESIIEKILSIMGAIFTIVFTSVAVGRNVNKIKDMKK